MDQPIKVKPYEVDLCAVFSRLATDFDLDVQTRRYCINRIKNEGAKFLTSTLPNLGKLVLHALESGDFAYSRENFPADGANGFTCIAWQGGLLRYFRGFLLKIFAKNGKILPNPCPVAIYAIRQVTEYLYKLALPFTDEQLAKAEEKFIKLEEDLASTEVDLAFIDQLNRDLINYYPRISNALLHQIYKEWRPRPGRGTYSTSFVLHGRCRGQADLIVSAPGSIQSFVRRGRSHVLDHSMSGYEKPYNSARQRLVAAAQRLDTFGSCPKFLGTRYFSRYNRYGIPTDDFSRDVEQSVRLCHRGNLSYDLLGNASRGSLLFPDVRTVDPRRGKHELRRFLRSYRRYTRTYEQGSSSPWTDHVLVTPLSEVLFVPKDSRGPRTIVREPFDALKYQLGFFDWLSSTIEKCTRNHVNFVNQQINQELAKKGSIDGSYATMDLKDASDSVRFDVVKRLFRNCPGITKSIERYRTQFALLPSGGIIKLAKLSGMGSGFTFPIMAMLIYLAVCREIANTYRLTYEEAKKHVYVYGDDLIVTTRYSTAARTALQKAGLRLNLEKSFFRGNFRESCGGDYFCGQPVAPLRLRLAHCDLDVDGHLLRVGGSFDTLTIERHCRQLVKDGLKALPEYYYKLLERRIGQRLPYVSGESPIIGRYHWRVSYPTDATGAYVRKRVLTHFTRKVEDYENPYIHLGSNLRRRYDKIGQVSVADSACEELGIYTEPHSIGYRWQTESAFRLMG